MYLSPECILNEDALVFWTTEVYVLFFTMSYAPFYFKFYPYKVDHWYQRTESQTMTAYKNQNQQRENVHALVTVHF